MPINKEIETMISVVISKDSKKKLKEICKNNKRSISSQVALLTEDFVNKNTIREKVKSLPFGKSDIEFIENNLKGSDKLYSEYLKSEKAQEEAYEAMANYEDDSEEWKTLKAAEEKYKKLAKIRHQIWDTHHEPESLEYIRADYNCKKQNLELNKLKATYSDDKYAIIENNWAQAYENAVKAKQKWEKFDDSVIMDT